MIENILTLVEQIVVEYGAFGVFLATIIEEVVSIIPSSAVIMFAGFFMMGGAPIDSVSLAVFFTKTALPAAFGLAIGSLFLYGVAYWLGKPAIERFGKYTGVFWKDIEKTQTYMRGGKMDEVILLLVRGIPIVPFSVASVFCGLVRWNLWSYLLITFFGGFIRASIISFLGWQLGNLYKEHISLFERLENIIIFILVLFLVAFLLYRRLYSKNESR